MVGIAFVVMLVSVMPCESEVPLQFRNHDRRPIRCATGGPSGSLTSLNHQPVELEDSEDGRD